MQMKAILNERGVQYRLTARLSEMQSMVETFGEFISRYRRERGLSQAELARRIDKSKAYVNQLERDLSTSSKSGKPKPTVEVVESIARILHIPTDEARLAAGYAPIKARPEPSDDAIAVTYLRELPADIKADAVAILETLWRRHSNSDGSVMPPNRGEDNPKPVQDVLIEHHGAVMSTGKPRAATKNEQRLAKRDIDAARKDAREDQARRGKK